MELAAGAVGVGQQQHPLVAQPGRHLLGELGRRPGLAATRRRFDHDQGRVGVEQVVERFSHGAVAVSTVARKASTFTIRSGTGLSASSLSARR